MRRASRAASGAALDGGLTWVADTGEDTDMGNRTIALSGDGVALWLVVRDDTLPEVVHWGPVLPDTAADLAGSLLAT
jgi:hypothetical protein